MWIIMDDYGTATDRYGLEYDRKLAQDDKIRCLAPELSYLLFVE